MYSPQIPNVHGLYEYSSQDKVSNKYQVLSTKYKY